MFSLAPINLDASSAGTSRILYLEQTQIETLIINSVNDVITEWDQCKVPLSPQSRNARNLLASVDHFLANGCVEGNRLYWRFIVEFLSKSHIKYYKQECRFRGERDLCVIWLKESLNNRELSYYFQSFLLNWSLVRKHYTAAAMIRKRDVTKKIAAKLYEIADVQFCFLVRNEVQENVPIAVVRVPRHTNTPVTSSPTSSRRATVKRKKRYKNQQKSEEISDGVLSAISDIHVAPDLVENAPDPQNAPFLSTKKDFDYVITEIVEKGEKELPSGNSTSENLLENRENCNSKTKQPLMESNSNVDENGNMPANANATLEGVRKGSENPFDVALKSSISQARLILSRENGEGSQKRQSPLPLFTDLAPLGEVCLDVGDVIGLSINVFKTEMEKYLQFFQVYEKFGTGHPEKRFLVLSNHSVYMLSLEGTDESARKSYVTHAYLPLQRIEFIYVSPDYQTLFVHMEKGFASMQPEANGQVVEVCTASDKLGETIVHAISLAYSNGMNNKELDVYVEETPHHFILKKFMERELHEEDLKLVGYTLAQWRQTSADCPGGDCVHYSGYLYHRTLKGGSWLASSPEFQQSFFHLQNQKLYHFTDSSCKVGERVISLQETASSISKISGDDSEKKFQLEFQNGDKLQFQCQSRAEMEKWISLLNRAISTTGKEDEAVACVVAISEKHVLIAQEGENCVVDGFMRALYIIDIEKILKATGVIGRDRYACVLTTEKKLDWLFLRTPDEVDRVLYLFEKLQVKQIGREEDGSARFVALINSLPKSGDLFYFEPFENNLSD